MENYPIYLVNPIDERFFKVIDNETVVSFLCASDTANGVTWRGYEAFKGEHHVKDCMSSIDNGIMVKCTEREFLEARTLFLAFAKKLEETINKKVNF